MSSGLKTKSPWLAYAKKKVSKKLFPVGPLKVDYYSFLLSSKLILEKHENVNSKGLNSLMYSDGT